MTRNFILLWLGSFTFFASFQLLLATMPLFARELGARDAQIGLIVGLFSAAALVLRPFTGWQLDRSRRVPALMIGATIFAISSASYLLVSSVSTLLALRIFHGCGIAIYTTASQTLVADIAPPTRRGEAMGLYGLALSVALGIAPAVGLYTVQLSGFPLLFVASCILAMAAVILGISTSEPARVCRGKANGRLFNSRAMRPAVIILAVMFAYGVTITFLPLLAPSRGLSNSGLFFTVYAATMVLAQIPAGRISDRYGRRAAILPGLVIAAIGAGSIFFLDGWWLLAGGMIYGLGAGSTQPSLFALAADLSPQSERGSAMATAGLFLELGIGSGALLGGLIVEAIGLANVFLFAGAAPAVGALVLTFVRTGWGSRPLVPIDSRG